MADGYVPAHTICAPGDQAVDPHEEGHGPIRAHTPVVMDIFPRSEKTGYFGDLTRTVVRGRASYALHEVYAIVHEGVRLGHRMIREGVEGMDVHREIQALFERQGYKTGVKDGRMQGFFHGTGHGLGLQIHEAPSIGKRPVRAAGGARRHRRAGPLLPGPRRRAHRGRGPRDEDGLALPDPRAEAARDLRGTLWPTAATRSSPRFASRPSPRSPSSARGSACSGSCACGGTPRSSSPSACCGAAAPTG